MMLKKKYIKKNVLSVANIVCFHWHKKIYKTQYMHMYSTKYICMYIIFKTDCLISRLHIFKIPG